MVKDMLDNNIAINEQANIGTPRWKCVTQCICDYVNFCHMLLTNSGQLAACGLVTLH